ncbi:MAG: hypothetical protein ACJ76F_02035 [Bacteroidia bacterium]
MKKAFLIVTLFSFLFSSTGSFLLYEFRRAELKAEAEERIRKSVPENMLTRICIQNNSDWLQINWEEKNEFSYQQELYDLVRTEKTKNGLILYCIKDSQENKLIAEFQKSSQKEQDQQSSKNKSAKKTIQLFHSVLSDKMFYPLSEKKLFTHSYSSVPEVQVQRHYPPPKFYSGLI